MVCAQRSVEKNTNWDSNIAGDADASFTLNVLALNNASLPFPSWGIFWIFDTSADDVDSFVLSELVPRNADHSERYDFPGGQILAVEFTVRSSSTLALYLPVFHWSTLKLLVLHIRLLNGNLLRCPTMRSRRLVPVRLLRFFGAGSSDCVLLAPKILHKRDSALAYINPDNVTFPDTPDKTRLSPRKLRWTRSYAA